MTVSFRRPDTALPPLHRPPAMCKWWLVTALALALNGCTQAPVVPAEDPAALQPRTAAGASIAPAGASTSEALAPTVSANPAIPPTDGRATSVGSGTGAVAPARAQMSAVQIAFAPSVTPDGTTRYECVTGKVGEESRAAIVFPEKSGRICARFPAMGPCQYERSACRAKGGRVIRFDGVEITKDVEKEYDKQVQRFRLNAG